MQGGSDVYINCVKRDTWKKGPHRLWAVRFSNCYGEMSLNYSLNGGKLDMSNHLLTMNT